MARTHIGHISRTAASLLPPILICVTDRPVAQPVRHFRYVNCMSGAPLARLCGRGLLSAGHLPPHIGTARGARARLCISQQEKAVEMIVRISLIALMVFGVDYAVRCGYMLAELLQDRWYERPPGKYILAAHDPSRMARLLSALVTINLTLALM